MNGFSATLDLCKYFHMFLTKPKEHKYIGLEHPSTGKIYVYQSFPMGTRNSPRASRKFGAAFIRVVMDISDSLREPHLIILSSNIFHRQFHIQNMEKAV